MFKSYLGTVVIVSLTGAATLFGMIEFHMQGDAVRLILNAAVGAAVGGVFTAPFFGRSGGDGFAIWLVAAVIATYIGAVCGGLAMNEPGLIERPTLILVTIPFFVFTGRVASPEVGLTWCAGMLLARFVATRPNYS